MLLNRNYFLEQSGSLIKLNSTITTIYNRMNKLREYAELMAQYRSSLNYNTIKVYFYDLETEGNIYEFLSNVRSQKLTVTAILFYECEYCFTDATFKLLDKHEYIKAYESSDKEIITLTYHLLANENKPYLLIGYNSEKFDNLVLYAAFKSYQLTYFKLDDYNRISIIKPNAYTLDLLPMARASPSFKHLDRYGLKQVGPLCCKQNQALSEKEIYGYMAVELYQTDLNLFIKYLQRDVEYTFAIGNTILSANLELWHYHQLPFEALTYTVVGMSELALAYFCVVNKLTIWKTNIVYNCTEFEAADYFGVTYASLATYKDILSEDQYNNLIKLRDSNKYSGAFAGSKETGIHRNVAYLDFGSMYATIIIAIYERLQVHKQVQNEQWLKFEKLDLLAKVMYENIKPLLEKRNAIKLRLKKVPRDSLEYKGLETLSSALKLNGNGNYGCTGRDGNKAFVCWMYASLITATGRMLLLYLVGQALTYGKSLDPPIIINCIQVDTDGAQLTGFKSQDQVLSWLAVFNEQMKCLINPVMVLEFEAYIPMVILPSRPLAKNYIQVNNNKVTIKGALNNKRILPPIIRQSLQTFCLRLSQLDSITPTLIDKLLLELTREIEDVQELNSFIISSQMKKYPPTKLFQDALLPLTKDTYFPLVIEYVVTAFDSNMLKPTNIHLLDIYNVDVNERHIQLINTIKQAYGGKDFVVCKAFYQQKLRHVILKYLGLCKLNTSKSKPTISTSSTLPITLYYKCNRDLEKKKIPTTRNKPIKRGFPFDENTKAPLKKKQKLITDFYNIKERK